MKHSAEVISNKSLWYDSSVDTNNTSGIQDNPGLKAGVKTKGLFRALALTAKHYYTYTSWLFDQQSWKLNYASAFKPDRFLKPVRFKQQNISDYNISYQLESHHPIIRRKSSTKNLYLAITLAVLHSLVQAENHDGDIGWHFKQTGNKTTSQHKMKQPHSIR